MMVLYSHPLFNSSWGMGRKVWHVRLRECLVVFFIFSLILAVARLPLAGGTNVFCCLVGSWFLSLLQDEHATTPTLVVWASSPEWVRRSGAWSRGATKCGSCKSEKLWRGSVWLAVDLVRSEGADPGSSSDDETQRWRQIPHTSAGVMVVGCHLRFTLSFSLFFSFFVSMLWGQSTFQVGGRVYFVHVFD